MISVLLVDDQPSVRTGLRMRLALEADVTVVGEAANGEIALAMARTLHPDVALMDVRMPVMDGIAATAALREVSPGTAVIVLSLYCDPITRERARAAGAAAFVEKHSADQTLSAVIRQVAADRAG
jgi:two-component system, NarL family, response regulator DesR